MKLKCLGAFPYRKQSLIIEEWSFKAMPPDSISHELSDYEAKLIQERYKNCFIPFVEEKKLEPQQDKMLHTKGKNK